MTKLPFECVVPDFAVNEIAWQVQGEAVHSLVENGVLTVVTATAEEMEQIVGLNQAEKALSIPDCSVLILARIYMALILSNDSRIRRHAKKTGLECHGTVWVLRQLIRRKGVNVENAWVRLSRLMATNPRLPRAERTELLKELDKAA